MSKKTTIILTGLILIILGCTGAPAGTQVKGAAIKVEVTPQTAIPPGGSVLVRALVSNSWENTLGDVMLKLARSYGDLDVNGGEKIDTVNNVIVIGNILPNPNMTLPGSWTINVKETATKGAIYENNVRMCFAYNQTTYNEIILIKEPGTNITPKRATENGPLRIDFAGLDRGFIYNEELNIKEKIPITISIKNNYNGYIGDITTSAQAPTKKLRKITIRLSDTDADEDGLGDSLAIISGSESPKELVCNMDYNPEVNAYECIAEVDDLGEGGITMFGNETVMLFRAEITALDTDILVQKVEVIAEYDYCIQGDTFTIKVYDINMS